MKTPFTINGWGFRVAAGCARQLLILLRPAESLFPLNIRNG